MPKKMSKSGAPRSTRRGHRKGSATRITARKASAARARVNKTPGQMTEGLMENIEHPPHHHTARGNRRSRRNAHANKAKHTVHTGR
jgi:hypothetical protein